MKNKTSILLSLLLLTIPLSLSATANFEITPDIETLVPENTLIYFQISSPEEFAQNMDKFLESTDLNQLIGNMTILDSLAMIMESDNSRLSLDYIDLTKPVGFALFPKENTDSDGKDMDFMMLLPVGKNKNILDILRKKPEKKAYWYKLYMNYIVFFSSESLKTNFPPRNIKDLSQIDNYENDSFTLYLDMNGFIKYLYPDSSKLIREFNSRDSGDSDFSANLIKGYISVIGEIKALFSNLTLNSEGITIKNDLSFDDTLEQELSTFTQTGEIKKWSSFLPEEGIFQGIFLLDSNNQKFIRNTITKTLFSSSKNDPLIMELMNSIELFSKFRGDGGIFSMNLLPYSSKNPEIPFDIDFSMVTDITDREGYLREFRNYYSDKSLNTILDKIDPDISLSINLSLEELNSEDLSPVFRIKYQISDRKIKSENNSGETDLSKVFLERMEYWYYFTNNKAYSYMGSRGLEGLRDLINLNSSEKEWISSAPEESSLIWNFSLDRIMEILNTSQILNEFITAKGISFSVSGFSGFRNGVLHSTTKISTDNIINLLQLFPAMEQ